MRINSPLTLVIVLVISSLLSCSTPPNSTGDHPIVKITHSSGDQLDPQHSYLGLPVNAGQLLQTSSRDMLSLVMGEALAVGAKVEVDIIGAVHLELQDQDQWIILTQPIDTSRRTISVEDMNHFATVHSSAKWQIEQYLQHYQGLQQVRVTSWEDREYVDQHLLR